jgi:hypothetical protein
VVTPYGFYLEERGTVAIELHTPMHSLPREIVVARWPHGEDRTVVRSTALGGLRHLTIMLVGLG